MTNVRTRVAIVGAGPAGASCANALLLEGAGDVALIDKARFPRDKSCGDGVGPGAVAVMKSLGLGERLAAHCPVRLLSFSGPSGRRVKSVLPCVGRAPPVGYTIPRAVFDTYLVQAALARGAQDFTGHQLEDAAFDEGAWRLTLKNRAGVRRELAADILVGADGARSKVRRILGVPMNSDRHTGAAIRVYGRASGGGFDALQLDFTARLVPGYGWYFPIDAARANIGVGLDLSGYMAQASHLEGLLRLYQDALGPSVTYDESTRLAFILPYGSELPPLAFPRLRAALAGDAASMINPLTGEGIFYGMFAGELLGRLLAPALRDGAAAGIDAALDSYAEQFTARFRRHFRVNWSIKERVADPAWCDRVLEACARDEAVLGDLIAIAMGDKNFPRLRTLFRVYGAGLLGLGQRRAA